jgi:hypothetical protein
MLACFAAFLHSDVENSLKKAKTRAHFVFACFYSTHHSTLERPTSTT